ncbi:MAG: DNA polymerase III subunit gamma/tau [Clostridiales bacterium]|nr:DNA polymerase III subunit gamma/tau [Clostridiales bacterium]MDY4008086.1 DNA polymerase III subunit gamma/tau [Candidatus Limiplasma sp.]
MAYQALYRKWRPQTFEQVLGQTATVKTLRRQVEAGRIAHAYLFCGCRGTGKTSMAKLMSRAINCRNPNHGDPCGECEACRAIINETTMDVLELDAASNNSVDNIRELLEQVRYPAQLGRYKVYIIDEVHMLSTAAFNALLKTLEEPPAHVVFILATTEPQKLPATILSRVQRYDFGRIPSSLMVERMREALQDMGMEAEDEALRMVARAAEGAMRDAFSILDMCVAGAENGRITAAQTRDILGASDREFLYDFFDLLSGRDECGVMHKVDELMRSGREAQVFLRELSAHCRALLTVKAVKQGAASILDVTEEDEARYRKQAEGFSQERLLKMLELFMRAEGELRFASTPRIGLECAALHACEQNMGEDNAALLERIGELEAKLRSLEADLASGRLKAAAAPGEAAPKRAAKPAAAKAEEAAGGPPQPPVPADAKGIWDRAMELLSKTEPPLFGLLRNERFIGAKGNVYQVLIPAAKKEFSYVRLNQQARREKVSKALSEAAGTPLLFEAVLESDAQKRQDAARSEAQQSLINAFGREMVQIDEEQQP